MIDSRLIGLWISVSDSAPGSIPLSEETADHAGQPSDGEEKREEYGHHHTHQHDSLGTP